MTLLSPVSGRRGPGRGFSSAIGLAGIVLCALTSPARAGGFEVRIVDAPDIVLPSDVVAQLAGPLLPATIMLVLLAVSSDSTTAGDTR